MKELDRADFKSYDSRKLIPFNIRFQPENIFNAAKEQPKPAFQMKHGFDEQYAQLMPRWRREEEVMQDIAKGRGFRVAVDTAKNRIYFWIFGDAVKISGSSPMPNYTEKACDLMKPGFTLLADFSEMKMLGLPDVVQQVQSRLLNAGIRKVASVWSEESFAKFIVDSSAQKLKSGEYSERRKVFKDRIEAEAWLDE
jgi:hypothetical protein